MQRVKLCQNLDVSRLAYGMWRLTDDQNTSAAHVRNKLSACLEQRHNHD